MCLPITLIYDTMSFYPQTDLLELKEIDDFQDQALILIHGRLRRTEAIDVWRTPPPRNPGNVDPNTWGCPWWRSCFWKTNMSCISPIDILIVQVQFLLENRCMHRLSSSPMHHFHLPPPPFHVVFPPSPSLFCPILFWVSLIRPSVPKNAADCFAQAKMSRRIWGFFSNST